MDVIVLHQSPEVEQQLQNMSRGDGIVKGIVDFLVHSARQPHGPSFCCAVRIGVYMIDQ